MKKILIIVGIIILVIIAGVTLLTLNKTLPVDIYVNKGAHMEPAVKDGEQFTAKKSDSYKRGDIVIINSNGLSQYLPDSTIARIIALPTETIEIKGSQVFINGNLIDESYATGTNQTIKVTLRANQYFCMGDNRKVSLDSRTLGPIDGSRILGIAQKI